MNVAIKDNNATWVMNEQFEFICTHDGSDHTEEVTVDTIVRGEHDEETVTLTICDDCNEEIRG
jgi:hypothetical protein